MATRRPFQPAQWTSQVTLNWTVFGLPAKNVLYYTWQSGVQGSPNATEIGPAIVANFTTAVRQNLGANTILQSVNVLRLDDATHPIETYTTGLPLAGSGTANIMPNNCAMVVKLLTNKRGRNYRGRLYIPGVIGQASPNTNRYASVQATNIANWIASMGSIGTASGQNYSMAIVSRWVNNSYRATCEVTPVTSMIADTLVHTQRRRLL